MADMQLIECRIHFGQHRSQIATAKYLPRCIAPLVLCLCSCRHGIAELTPQNVILCPNYDYFPRPARPPSSPLQPPLTRHLSTLNSHTPHVNSLPLSPSNTATIFFLRRYFTRAPSPATMSATKTKVQSIIDENAVAVFSKSYCPYCRQAKQLLSDKGAKFFAVELDQVGE
jgi:hypothetical protein